MDEDEGPPTKFNGIDFSGEESDWADYDDQM